MAFLAASSAAADVGSAILALAFGDELPESAGSPDGFVRFWLLTSVACAIMLCRWSSAELQLVSWLAALLFSFVALFRLRPEGAGGESSARSITSGSGRAAVVLAA